MYRKFLKEFKGYDNKVPQQSSNGAAENKNDGTDKKKKLSEEERKKLEDLKKKMEDTLKLIEETEALLKGKLKPTEPKENTKKENDDEETLKEAHPLFYGNVAEKCPSTAKVVRIFTSSTFTDTEKERNTLMEQAYPKIKLYCQKKGYEFQVVDMRWGIRDEATDDHMTTELCLHELNKCQEISTGPYFVSLLSHKYGYRPLMREIDSEEFEKILAVTESEENQQLLKKWYERDDNNVPPVYVLKSISKNIPDFVSNDRDKKVIAKDAWWTEHEIMHDTLSSGADKVLNKEAARKYRISVTETEVLKGIQENPDTANTCVWFKRTIEDIEQQEPNKLLSRYIECLGPKEKLEISRELLHELRDVRLPKYLPENRIRAYTVHWAERGVNPDVAEHRDYLQRLANEFVDSLCNMVDEGIRRRATTQINDPLYEECLQHVTFCREKYEDFQGREETLQKIKDYILGSSNEPMVVHGSSGCGKTSIMAMAAKKAWDWFEGKVGIVLRFVGTTPKSSNITDFLSSVTRQVKLLNQMGSELPAFAQQFEAEFKSALRATKPTLPLLIIIDSLDQFDPANSARQLLWLPAKLPPNVKVLVSTLEEEKYESFPKLKAKIKTEGNFQPVPKLPENDVTNIIDHWLMKRGRTLTSIQRESLFGAFRKCPLPLFLKLSFDEACRWTSHDAEGTEVLQTTIHDSIHMLFSRLEKVHGKMFVSRALGYMTTAKGGVSEAEMEDILACDDAVLNDVYQYWTPPTRRLPPLLLVRLKSDLQQYLVERGIDGVRVMFWYHRQFIHAAKERYCSDKELSIILHKGLADYFSGTWSNGKKKPYIDKKGVECEADRYVSSQPLQFGTLSNIRKLNRLPYHLTKSLDLERLKKECICHYKFLQLKLIETTVSQVLDDMILAETTFPEDQQIKLICATFQLSQQALMYNPSELPSQVIGRLSGQQDVADFYQQCENSPISYLRPDKSILTKPGGALKFALAGHKGSLRSLDLKQDGQTAVTTADDGTIQFWNIKDGRNIRSLKDLGDTASSVQYIDDDKLVLVDFVNGVKAYRERGDVAYHIPFPKKNYSVCAAGPLKCKILTFQINSASIYNASNGDLLDTIIHDFPIKFDGVCYPYGTHNYAVVMDGSNEGFTVLNLNSKKFSPIKKAFEKDEDGDYPTMDALVVTADEKHVVFASCLDNDLHFHDIETLKEERVIKGVKDDFSQNFHVSSDGKYLYFPSNSKIIAFDLKTCERKEFFEHDANLVDVKTLDFNIFVTITDDSSVRVWDITKAEATTSITSQGFDPHETITDLQALSNGRYVFCVTKNSKTSDTATLMFYIYDIVQNYVVRKTQLASKDSFKKAKLLNDKSVAVVTDSRKLKIVNLQTMNIETVCKGKLCEMSNDPVVIFDGQEIAIPSRGRLFVKIYDATTGKTLALMKGGQSQRIEDMKASANSSILLVSTDEGPYLIFNLKTRQCIQTLEKNLFKIEDWALQDTISSDGKFVGIMADKKIGLPRIPGKKTTSTNDNVLILWDVEQGKIVKELHDRHMMLKYHISPNKDGKSVSADEVVNLDDKYILTSHDDFIMRVWDVKTGNPVRRLHGHFSNCELQAIDGSPYILSNASWDEEKAIRLWSRQTFQSLASFQFDKSIKFVKWLKTGKSFITTETDTPQIVHWQLSKLGKLMDDLSGFPVIFPGKEIDLKLDLHHDDDNIDDPDDLDTDVDEPEIEYSDDDDDDDDDDDADDDGGDGKDDI